MQKFQLPNSEGLFRFEARMVFVAHPISRVGGVFGAIVAIALLEVLNKKKNPTRRKSQLTRSINLIPEIAKLECYCVLVLFFL